ncbi:VOC family protein [Pelagibacterium lentulum]|uniref:Glyoxalase n=1 Tax=Pelagibacterium lentulum TaxID=2029865 RepID=A0A916W270_9HYPH|nr:VOC family protein [Pelagibacterium lentulum]GGA60352.1 glyoxalase [Pelagibacterium lentulum]
MIPGIVVPTILVKDVDRSIHFYGAVAGYEVLARDNIRTLLGLSNVSTEPKLCLIDEMSQMVPRAARGMVGGVFLSIIVQDVANCHAAALTLGAEVIEAPHGRHGAVRAILRDPDGVVIDVATAEGYALELPRKRHA